MILVTGATGSIGSELIRLLTSARYRVRALVRDPAKAQSLGPQVEVARGDLSRPETLPDALAGAEKIFAMFNAHDIPAQSGPLFEAAKRAHVRHVVYLSSATIHFSSPTQIGRWHLAGEEALKAAGVGFTMLRPGNFSTNTLRWAGTIRAQGSVFVPYADSRSTPIDQRDIAAVAAAALTAPGHEGKTYTLGGPEVLTPRQQVEIIAAALERPLKIVEVPEAGARAGMLKAGMTEALAESILELQRTAAREPYDALTSVVSDLTGAPPRAFAAWVRDHLHAFR